MKIVNLIFLVVLTWAGSASAIYMEGMDRPIASGVLNVDQATGMFAGLEEVSVRILSREDFTDLKLELMVDEDKLVLDLDFEPTHSCGSLVQAVAGESAGTLFSGHYFDNSYRVCKDVRAGPFEVLLRADEGSFLHLGGVMEPVYTIQIEPRVAM